MATVTKKMSPSEIQALYKRIKPFAKWEKQPQYTVWQVRIESMSITAYQFGKVVFQGEGVDEFLAADPAEKTKTKSPAAKVSYPMAGSDEVGVGDYFGPLVVAACVVPDEATAQKLQVLGIRDSKQLTDEQMLKIAPEIKKLCPYSICVLSNVKYNQQHETYNANALKALLHNQVYLNLEKKGITLPALRVVDQFCVETTYYRHLKGQSQIIKDLTFVTKAENKYIAVAAASILARSAFLETWDAMEDKFDFVFDKGAGAAVDRQAADFIEKFGEEALYKVAKVHFANTEKAKAILAKRQKTK